MNIRWLLFGLALILSSACYFEHPANRVSRGDLISGFKSPPDTIQTSVYWYWISDNISEEGVVRDLHSMKEVGINRAFIGNIGLKNLPYGEIRMLSEEWWQILHTALKTAAELDIKIGVFNSPGWSQSGGPWVKARNAMRYLNTSRTIVEGPSMYNAILPKPAEHFQDVRVIAYPLPLGRETKLDGSNSSIKSYPALENLHLLTDGDPKTGVKIPEEQPFILEMISDTTFTARSLTIQTTENPIQASVEIFAINEQGKWELVKEFVLNRSNPNLNVGFIPYAPVITSFKATSSEAFRIVLNYLNPEDWSFPGLNSSAGLAEVSLSPGVRIENYAEKTLAKMHPTPLPYWDDYLWEQQPVVKDEQFITSPSRVKDISDHLSEDGVLTWRVPEGKWVILRTGMTPTGTQNSPASPEATGFEVDKMSREHTELHFHGHMGEILERIPPQDRSTFKVVVQDSYETGGQNFTDGFLEDFQAVYGYDPVPFIPTLWGVTVHSQQASDRFLWDLRRLVADKIAYDYVGGLRDVSHKYGLTTWLENYGHWGFPGEFLMYGGQSDAMGGEFWSSGSLGDIENRAATSCGHIYGKQKISAESHTSGPGSYSRSPKDFKQRGDRFFAEGINNTLLHVFIHQPYEEKNPGVNAWFGNSFNRKNTWFGHLDLFIDYIKRTNLMLQQGLNVADVCYFIGEDAPKMTGVTDPPLPVGYQFDYMNAEVIEKHMTVKDGKLTLPHGTQYRLMVLPNMESMRPELLSKIVDLVEQGAAILGPPPKWSPSLQGQPESDRKVKELADLLWGSIDGVNNTSRRFGNGLVMNGLNMEEALAELNCIPDCQLPDDRSIHYGHRTSRDREIYFISNQTDSEKTITPAFRVTGLQPELWEATTGSVRDLPAFRQNELTTEVPLKMAPFESIFIVFDKPVNESKGFQLNLNYPPKEMVAILDRPWEVTFDARQTGLGKPLFFDHLKDWTTHSNDQIKYYSGVANYTCSFSIPDSLYEGSRIFFDPGSFNAMLKLYINDKYVGGLWTPPHTLEISSFLTKGENEIRIEVVNNWMNRIIGDLRIPESERKTWLTVNDYTPNMSLQPSGLFGPVRILRELVLE